MWHKFKKDLFSYYSMQKVNGVMGVNGIMRTCHIYTRPLKSKNKDDTGPCGSVLRIRTCLHILPYEFCVPDVHILRLYAVIYVFIILRNADSHMEYTIFLSRGPQKSVALHFLG